MPTWLLLLLQGCVENSCESGSTDFLETNVALLASLSPKQLKDLLVKKVSCFESAKKDAVLQELNSVVEKKDLVTLVSDHVDFAEIGSLLSSATPSVSKIICCFSLLCIHYKYLWIKFSLPPF